MSKYIPEDLRKLVAERAGNRCEYCRIPDSSSFFSFHIDHVISIKHGGKTELKNLAYSWQICNLKKGTDIGTFLEEPTLLIRFYNPRDDKWADHFALDTSGELAPKSAIGAATIKILELNHPDSILERRELIRIGQLPD
jgi:5-methylcytosine-specific restriction endonuclease McrA